MQPHLTFVQITDSHLGPARDYSYFGHFPYRTLARAIDLINAMPQLPDFVVHTGDVSNDCSAESYALAAELLGRLRVPLYLLSGNHDDRALLRRAYGELSTVGGDLLYANDLVLDRASGQAWRGKALLNLTPTEFRLLAVLIQHQGQVLSRQQILDAVWGYSAEVESERTVNVHIRRLREKIETDPGAPELILTVPGSGYRFASE